jgi:hypothetical protein
VDFFHPPLHWRGGKETPEFDERVNLVPAVAVIPVLRVYSYVVAVKKFVVEMGGGCENGGASTTPRSAVDPLRGLPLKRALSRLPALLVVRGRAMTNGTVRGGMYS